MARTDLTRALRAARDKHVDLVNASSVLFSESGRGSISGTGGGPISISLGKFVDHDPVCIEPRTPLAHAMDMFTKLGLRQVLVTHRGKLRGIITRKDVLRHVDYLKVSQHGRSLF